MEQSLLYLALACKKVLCQPSCAAVERVFSILNNFSNSQYSDLEDYIETTLMLHYNQHN